MYPTTFSNNTFPVRLVIHGHHPDKETLTEGERTGKLIHLPESIEDLLSLAGESYFYYYYYYKKISTEWTLHH